MKIIHVITGLETGGAENALYRLLKSFPSERHQFRVVSLNGKGTLGPKIEALNIPVVDLEIENNHWPLAGFFELLRYCSAEKPDVLQGWMYHANLAVTLVAPWVKPNPRTIWGIRGSLHDKRSFKYTTRAVIRLCGLLSSRTDALVFNSETGAALHAESGYRMDRAIVVPNGFIDVDSACSTYQKDAVRNELGIDPDALVVGTVGRYHYAKGSDLFFQMMDIVLASMPEVKVMCLGRGMNRLNSDMAQYSWTQEAYLMGDRDDVPRMLSAMDIFVSASRTEGFPNALAEAMLVGLPCVASDVGDSRAIMADGGVMVEPSNVVALAEAVLGLLNIHKDERQSIGLAGRAHVLKNYSQTRCTQAYLNLYDHLLTAK